MDWFGTGRATNRGALDNRRALSDKPPVFSRVGHLLLVIALLGATGAHWVALQSVAWATMLANNARTDSLPAAFEKTFDGKHPCALCKQIAQGRQDEKRSDAQLELKKLEFLHQRVALGIDSPSTFVLLGFRTDATAPLRTQSPPVPPPRSLPG
jgi:hypothetical protein